MGNYVIDNVSGRNYNVTLPSQNLELCRQLNREDRIVREIVKLIDVDGIEDKEVLDFVKVMKNEVR